MHPSNSYGLETEKVENDNDNNIELIYNFNSKATYEYFYYPKGYHVKTTFVKIPSKDFTNSSLSIKTLASLYLDKKAFETKLKNVIDFFTYTNEDVEQYIFQYRIPKEFANIFDDYYENKYAMKRSEILDLVKVRSEKEINQDNEFELAYLKQHDNVTKFMYNRIRKNKKNEYKKLKDLNNEDLFDWNMVSLIGNTILGGMLSRLVYEYIQFYSHSSNCLTLKELNNIKEEIIDFKDFLLNFTFQMSPSVEKLWTNYI